MSELTNNTCTLTDDELIARVLELEKKVKSSTNYDPLSEERMKDCYELKDCAPDLARRLQKANERLKHEEDMRASLTKELCELEAALEKANEEIARLHKFEADRWKNVPDSMRVEKEK